MASVICDGKYLIGGPDNDSIGLPVLISDLPEAIKVEGIKLLKKSSFHVTLICVGKIIKKYNVDVADFLEKIIDDFCHFVRENPIELLGYKNEFRVAAEDEKRSLVVMCEVSNIEKFYDAINKKYSLQLEYPPTHVTLYTLQPDVGIFLTDKEEMEQLSKPTINPGLSL